MQHRSVRRRVEGKLNGRWFKARTAVVVIAVGGSYALGCASPALAGSLDFDPATKTMTYTGGPGPDVPKWADPESGFILIDDAVPMQVTDAVFDNCRGDASFQFIQCPADRVVADLGGGDDRSRGGSSNDVMLGGDGNDLLVGGGGADRIDGGAGDDDLSPQRDTEDTAGDGPDELIGGPGTDLVRYRQVGGPHRISLDDVADDGRAGEGDNVHSDVENVISASSDDVIVGSAANNEIDGGTGKNLISGRAGNDRLSALGGDDVLSGDAGDDSLLGGAGSNTLDGGPGLDHFGGSAFSCDIFDCSLGVDEFRANDGVKESIDCSGVAGSKAIVDALDTVANCRTVIRPRVSKSRPSIRVRSRVTRRALLRRGVVARVTCPGACKVRLRLSIKDRVIASRRTSLKLAGSKSVRLKLNKRAQLRVRRASRLTLKLATTFSEATGTTRKANRITVRRK